jgi:hypothetical protein
MFHSAVSIRFCELFKIFMSTVFISSLSVPHIFIMVFGASLDRGLVHLDEELFEHLICLLDEPS